MSDKQYWEDFYRQRLSERVNFPRLDPRESFCRDCPVECGMYAEFAEGLSMCDADIVLEYSKTWWCHNSTDKACRGNWNYQKRNGKI